MSTRVKSWGNISYEDLSPESRDDVISSIAYITGESEDEVKVGLENGPALLPLVFVSPKLIYFEEGRGRSKRTVEQYAAGWSRGDEFPPVTIDSSKSLPYALIEGGHRVASAILAGVAKILAIALAGVRVVKTPEGLETYGFKGTGGKSR